MVTEFLKKELKLHFSPVSIKKFQTNYTNTLMLLNTFICLLYVNVIFIQMVMWVFENSGNISEQLSIHTPGI